jgi:hypothetical protein
MRRPSRSGWARRALTGAAAAGTVTAALLLGLPGAASAATTLPVNAALISGGDTQAYRFDATAAYWSVVAVEDQPVYSHDFDLTLTDAAGTVLATSNGGASTVDFVAVNANVAPTTEYRVRADPFPAPAKHDDFYEIELARPNLVLAPQSDTGEVTVDLNAGQHNNSGLVTVRDVFLRAGQTATFQARSSGLQGGVACPNNPGGANAWAGELFVLPAGVPAASRFTAVASAAWSSVSGPNACGATLSYRAPRDGWYGLVLVSDRGSDPMALNYRLS